MAEVLENDPLLLIDSRMAINSFKKIAVIAGPKNVVTQIFPSNSASSSTQSVTILTPSVNTLVNRYVLYHMVGSAQINGTTSGTGATFLYVPGVGINCGLSENWFCQVIQNENVQIGTISNSINPSQCGVELMRIHKKSHNDAIYQTMTGGALPDIGVAFQAWNGTNKDVLAPYYDTNQSDHVAPPRTNRIWVTATTSTTMTVNFDVYWPSMVPPFLQSDECEEPGLWGQTNYIYNINFVSDLSRMFSIMVPTTTAPAFSYTGVSNFTVSKFEIQAQFITPNDTVLRALNATSSLYNYYTITNFPTQPGTIAYNTNPTTAPPVITFSLNQITFSTIPDYLMIGARLSASNPSNLPALVPRYWLPIIDQNPCMLYWDNNSVLNGMNREQLYNACVRNGLNMPYEQFTGRDVTYNQIAGSPNYATFDHSLVLGGGFLLLNPSKDLLISNNDDSNGVRGQHTLTGTISFQNTAYANSQLPGSPQYELFVIALNGGVLRAEINGEVEATIGVMSHETAMRVLNSGRAGIPEDTFDRKNIHAGFQGGSFFNRLKNFAKNAVSYAINKAPQITKLANYALNNKDKLLGYANQGRKFLGLGYENPDEDDEEYDGGAYLNTDKKTLSNKKALALEYMRGSKY